MDVNSRQCYSVASHHHRRTSKQRRCWRLVLWQGSGEGHDGLSVLIFHLLRQDLSCLCCCIEYHSQFCLLPHSETPGIYRSILSNPNFYVGFRIPRCLYLLSHLPTPFFFFQTRLRVARIGPIHSMHQGDDSDHLVLLPLPPLR